MLAVELGIEPEPDTDTAALAERIRTQTSPVPPQIPRAAPQLRPPGTSVAFLGNLFTGRMSEYQALVSSFEHASAGQPRLVVLRGETGIGKTRLAKKFRVWANAQGAELLYGSAFESGSHLPFQPLVVALRLLFESENSPKYLLDDCAGYFSQPFEFLSNGDAKSMEIGYHAGENSLEIMVKPRG